MYTTTRSAIKGGLRYLRRQLLVSTPLNVLNASVPTRDLAITHNIVYGQHRRKRLDVYRPTDIAGRLPVVVFFYGGKWMRGHRDDYLFAAQAFASLGYVVVVPDYRLYPEVKFPDFVHDGAAAVNWTATHVKDYRGDPSRIVLVGHSAGAYIAAKIAFDPTYLDTRNVDPAVIRGLVGMSGPYNFLSVMADDPELVAVFGRHAASELSQPITFATENAPPSLFITGEEDPIVSPANAITTAARLQELGVDAQVHTYPGIGHAGTVLALAHNFRWRAGITEDIAQFLERHAGQQVRTQ